MKKRICFNRKRDRYDFSFKMSEYKRKHKKLRGGWDVGPDEFKSLGFTVGLPPNLYIPQTTQISNLSQRFENCDSGFSAIDSKFSVTERQKLFESGRFVRCYVNSFPPNMSSQDLQNHINQTLFKKKLTSSPDVVSKVTMNPQGQFAFVDFEKNKDAEKFLELKDSFTIDGYTLRIRKSTMSSANDISTLPHERTNSIFIDGIGELTNEADIMQKQDDIKNICSKYVEVSSVQIPVVNGCALGYAIVDLCDTSLADFLCMKLHFGHSLNAVRCFKKLGQHPRDEMTNEKLYSIKYYGKPIKDSYAVYNGDNLTVADILNLDIDITGIESEPPKTRSKFLKIYNVLSANAEKKEISDTLRDIRDECDRYGKVVDAYVDDHWPKIASYLGSPIIVEFETCGDARDAQMELSGRTYCGKVVITCNENPTK